MDACRNEELLTQLNWRQPSQSTTPTPPLSLSPIPDRLILCQSTLSTPPDFLLLSWLACHLHANQHVLLVNTARSRQHYVHTGRKWNVNVAGAEAAGLLTLIDAYCCADDTAYAALPTALHTRILQTIQSASHPLHVAIDDLTLLTLLTPHTPTLHTFLSQLRTTTQSLLLITPSDIPSHRSLLSHMAQWADCVVGLSGLRMGASREVDGVLEVVKRDVLGGVDRSRVVLFYRLQANGIQLSTKGAQQS